MQSIRSPHLVLHKKVIYLFDKRDFFTSIQCFNATSFQICHQSKLSIPQKGHKPLERIQRPAIRWAKGLRGLTHEERLQALNQQRLEKRKLRNDLFLTQKILYNHIDLEGTQLFMFSSRPRLRRASIRLLHQTGRTRRRRNSFACRVVNNRNRLPLTVALVTEQRKFKKAIRLICLLINLSLYSIFAPVWSLGHFVPSRLVNTYKDT